ncbi:MAG: hypothetical protein QXO37_08680 [Candidatus Nitrosocaldaceae archaeon]
MISSKANITEGLREWIEGTLLWVPKELDAVYGGWEYADADLRLKVFEDGDAVVLFYWRKVFRAYSAGIRYSLDLSHLTDEQINEIDEEIVQARTFDDLRAALAKYIESA